MDDIDAGYPTGLSDDDLLSAYQRTSGEELDWEGRLLLQEIGRRGLGTADTRAI